MAHPDPLVLDFPFTGRWRVENSPADRVPSHGTHLFGTAYAIDFTPVDAHGVSARITGRTLFAPEAPELFTGFGRPVLAPVAGRVVAVHDAEPDEPARRTLLPQLTFLASQAQRARAGMAKLAGNHVVVQTAEGRCVAVCHLQRGSVAVRPGDRVAPGDRVGACGNSGNSTEPHVHLQATDSTRWAVARGVPIAFRHGGRTVLPHTGEVVDV